MDERVSIVDGLTGCARPVAATPTTSAARQSAFERRDLAILARGHMGFRTSFLVFNGFLFAR